MSVGRGDGGSRCIRLLGARTVALSRHGPRCCCFSFGANTLHTLVRGFARPCVITTDQTKQTVISTIKAKYTI